MSEYLRFFQLKMFDEIDADILTKNLRFSIKKEFQKLLTLPETLEKSLILQTRHSVTVSIKLKACQNL